MRFKKLYNALRRNPQKTGKREKKLIKPHYRKTKDGKYVLVKSFEHEYPDADKVKKDKNKKGKDEGNFVKDKEQAINELACSLK